MNIIASMTGGRARESAAPARRFLLALLCILAFSFQGYIAQTHIHAPGFEGMALAKQSVPGQKQTPPADDPVRCPQCQLVFLTGTAVPPDAILFILPAQAFFSRLFAEPVRPAQSVASHAWHSRGPPRH